jgi:cytokinesis protein
MQLVPTPTKSSDREEFRFDRPPDEKVDELFNQLLENRDLPGSQRQSSIMGAVAGIAMDVKWQMVETDARKRYSEAKARKEQDIAKGKRGLVKQRDEKSPEWYLRHMMEQNVTRDVLGSLAVSLRTEPIQ